ncbi:MAG: hypothetical protein HY268_25410 [Deltaproteobacteria bacterium]|nr:hypothetical protein [Deltaproteobacteria bacterium]
MATVPTFTMKLIRADEHLKALNDEVMNFLAIRPYEVITQQDIPAGYLHAQVIYRHAPPDLLLMLIGDVLHNLRSALDHLAWSLARTRADSFTEFPIFIDGARFRATDRHSNPVRGSGLHKMHDMPASAQTIIESLQPYKGVHGLPESEPLWLLQQLGIEDKHHTLNLVAAGVDVRLDVSTSLRHPAYGLTGRTGYLPLEDGAEIYRIPLPANPSQVQDHSHSTFDVALDPKGPGRGISLREGLRNMREAVVEVIRLLEPLVP